MRSRGRFTVSLPCYSLGLELKRAVAITSIKHSSKRRRQAFISEQAGNTRFLARVENNLGFLFFTLGRYGDAHKHLDRARFLFLEITDVGSAAQVDDTRARTFLAEGKVAIAERVARTSVRTLERGGEQAVLAEAVNTHGVALARLGHDSRSRALLERAVELAKTTGDPGGAGRATLSIIEELGDKMNAKDLVSTFRSALDFSKNSQDPLTLKRLIASMEVVLLSLETPSDLAVFESVEWNWEGFSLKKETHKFEAQIIQRALRDSSGLVSKAARLLGFKHHQSLISLLSGRHKSLQTSRSAARKRRRTLFWKATTPAVANIQEPVTRKASILHIDDDKPSIEMVADALSSKDMKFDSCLSGTMALRKLTARAKYDLIIVDNDLPGLGGLELVKRVRNMARWRATPIIMLGSDDCESEAWRAGVDDFLTKPANVDDLVSRIERLLATKKETV